jgi:hypothetical protein
MLATSFGYANGDIPLSNNALNIFSLTYIFFAFFAFYSDMFIGTYYFIFLTRPFLFYLINGVIVCQLTYL